MKFYIASLIISLLYGGLSYLVFDNYIYAIATFAVYGAATLAFLSPLANKYEAKIKRHHQAYRFVNNFIVSLSVTSSPEIAYSSALEGIDDSFFIELTSKMKEMPVTERLEYLENFFEVPFYGMFLSIYRIYSDQGGDCLKVADPLLKEIARDEEYTRSLAKSSKKLLIQFVIFWLLSGFILGFLRFGLSGYYTLMLQSTAFKLIGVFYLMLVLGSFFIFARTYTGLPLLRRKKNA